MEESTPSSPAAPPRSCLACKRRKIRCSRGQPCTYCTKLHLQCVYPDASQETRRQGDSNDVLSRLQRIETSLLRLESSVARITRGEHPDPTPERGPATHQAPPATESTRVLENGKLVSEGGDTRYITSSLWADLEEAVQDGNPELDQTATAPSSVPSNPALQDEHSNGFVFGPSSTYSDLRQFHPSESRIFVLWQVYLESIDPLLKILHVPVTQRQLLRAIQNLDEVPPDFESLMFAIYYAAVNSLRNSVSSANLPKEERQSLLKRYKFGLEQALAKANFMGSPNMLTLQALTLYLVCAKGTADKTYTWTMTGLAIRLATKLGLHRDPVALRLPPFVSEMRRRLWWQICILDVRTAEDNDMDPVICEHGFDTKFPANVHDSDLDVNMTQPVVESSQHAEMVFNLARFDISYAARKILFSAKFNADNGYPNLTVDEKNQFIESVQKTVEEKYLKDYDMTIPIGFLTATSGRMVLAKIKLAINHPARNGCSGLTQDQFIDLTQSSIELIEDSHTLRSSDKYSRWVWLFQKYIEWDAVAFLLHSLCIAPLPGLVQRAWIAVETFFQNWEDHDLVDERRWRRLESLRAKAAAKRSTSASSAQAQAEQAVVNDSPLQLNRQQADTNPATQPLQGPAPGLSDPQIVRQSRVESGTMSMSTQGILHFPTQTGDYLDWNFDQVPFVMQGAPSWEMDVDEEMFNLWT